MSELARFRRLLKSLTPQINFRKRRDISQYYSPEDARNIINDLGLQIPPKILKALTNSDIALDEFVNGIYLAEDDVRATIVTPEAIIDPQYNPKVYKEDGRIGFTITFGGEEIVFAEFKLNYKK